jgi:hypothetical protein
MPRRPPKRIAIPRAEADHWALTAGTAAADEKDYEAGSARLGKLENKGLFRWTPDPWNAKVEKTNKPYFFWVYVLHYDYEGDFQQSWLPGLLSVGTDQRGGQSVIHVEDVEVEAWPPVPMFRDDREDEDINLMHNMRRATPAQLRKAGMTDIEILGLAMN